VAFRLSQTRQKAAVAILVSIGQAAAYYGIRGKKNALVW